MRLPTLDRPNRFDTQAIAIDQSCITRASRIAGWIPRALWPAGFAVGIDWIATVLAVGAAITLLRYQRNVIQVIVACALLGLATSMAGI